MESDFWEDVDHARKIYDQLSQIKKIVDQYDILASTLNSLDDMNEVYDLIKMGEEEFIEC